MKKIILLPMLAIISLSLAAQSYSVIHVIGKIYLPEQKIYLATGIKIDAQTKLKFETPDAKAAVMSADKGRFVIQQSTASTTSKSDLGYVLAGLITPVSGRMSTRSGGINNLMDFQKLLNENSVAWITNDLKFQVSPIAFPITDDRFFYVTYTVKGESVNKKVANHSDTIIFNRVDLFTIDGKKIDPATTDNQKLYYYSATKKESTLITPLNFALVSTDVLTSIYNSFPSMSEEEKLDGTLDVLHSLYGSCSRQQVLQALHQ